VRFAVVALLAACNSAAAITSDAPRADAYEPTDATLAVDGLAFMPASVTLAWPDTQKVNVVAHYTDDAIMTVTELATFSSDTPSVATVVSGTVLTRGPGTATITATYMGQTATMPVSVTVPTLAVASPDGVDFFLASAQGTPAPLRSIRGAATTLQHACGLAVLGGELFVADSAANTVDVWLLTATGNVAPERQIATSFTPVSIAASGTSIYVGASDGVRVFDATASGAATPTQTIAGATTTIASGAGISIYQGELYVVSGAGSVAVFPLAADGDVAPSRTIGGVNTGLASPAGIAVAVSLVFVTNELAEGAVQVFFPSNNGDVLPQETIAGDQTLLASPTSAAVADTMVFVGTPSTSSIEVFPTSTNGEFPPTETIGGVNVQAMAIF